MRERDAGCGLRAAGCGMRDAGRGTRDAGCGMRDAGRGMRPDLVAALQRFPLRHQVPDLPHERLVSVDHRLGGFVVVVKAGRGHLCLDLLHFRFALGDPRFELLHAAAPRAFDFPLLPRFCFLPLAFLVRRFVSVGLPAASCRTRSRNV